MGSSHGPLAPPPWLGIGVVNNRFVPLVPLPKLPWYYSGAWQAVIAGTAIAALILIGVLAP